MKRLLALLILSVVSLHATDETATAPNATRLKLAREVIEATQASKMLDNMSAQLQQVWSQQLQQAAQDLPEEQRANLEKAQKEIFDYTIEQTKWLINQMDVAYAEVFTEKELLAIKQFYESPEGRSMVEKQPLILQHMMPSFMEMQQKLVSKMESIMKAHGLAQ